MARLFMLFPRASRLSLFLEIIELPVKPLPMIPDCYVFVGTFILLCDLEYESLFN